MNRREFLKKLGIGGAGVVVVASGLNPVKAEPEVVEKVVEKMVKPKTEKIKVLRKGIISADSAASVDIPYEFYEEVEVLI